MLNLITVGLLVFCLSFMGVYCDADACPSDFDDRCLCGMAIYNGKERYVVNCTNTGFQHPAMLANLPVATEVLIFTGMTMTKYDTFAQTIISSFFVGNNITSMPWNIFGKMNDYPQLDVIDMTNNNIQEIKGKTYHRVGNVRTLILNHNQLNITGDKTHPRIFSNFINLESLHLTNAFTESIDSKEYLIALEQVNICNQWLMVSNTILTF